MVKPNEQKPEGWLSSFPRRNIWRKWSAGRCKDFKLHVGANVKYKYASGIITRRCKRYCKLTWFFTTFDISFCCRMGLRAGKPLGSCCSTLCPPRSYFTSKWMGEKISRTSFCVSKKYITSLNVYMIKRKWVILAFFGCTVVAVVVLSALAQQLLGGPTTILRSPRFGSKSLWDFLKYPTAQSSCEKWQSWSACYFSPALSR